MEESEPKQRADEGADGACGDGLGEPRKETPSDGNQDSGERSVVPDKPSEPEQTQSEEALVSEEQEAAEHAEPASMELVDVAGLTSSLSEELSDPKSLPEEKAVTLVPSETETPLAVQSEQLPGVPCSTSPTEEVTVGDTVSPEVQILERQAPMEPLQTVEDDSVSPAVTSDSCLAPAAIVECAKSTFKELGNTSKPPSASLQASSGPQEAGSTSPGEETDLDPKPPSPIDATNLDTPEPAAPTVSTSFPSTEPACSPSSGAGHVEHASALKEEVGTRPPSKRVIPSKTPFTASRDAASHMSPDGQNTTPLTHGMSEEASKQEASKLQEAAEVFPKPSAFKASALFPTPAAGSDVKPRDQSHPIQKDESKLSDGVAVKAANFPSGQTKPSNLSSAPPIGAAGCPPAGAKSSEPTAHPRRFGGARPRVSSKPCSPTGAANLSSATPIKTTGNTAAQREAGNGATPSRPPPRPWERSAAPFRTPNLRYSPRGRGGRVFASSDRAPISTPCVAHRSGGNPETCGIVNSGGTSVPPDNGSKEAVPRRSPQKKGARRKATREEQEGRGDEKAGAAAPAPSTSKDETPKFRRVFRNAEFGDGAKERGHPAPIPLPRNLPVNSESRKAAAEQWVQCPLPHVDPRDTDTMYLMSLKERISRFSPKKKSMLMMRMQEVLHEVEFETELS